MKDLKHAELAMQESKTPILVSEIEAIIKHNIPQVAVSRILFLIKGVKS